MIHHHTRFGNKKRGSSEDAFWTKSRLLVVAVYQNYITPHFNTGDTMTFFFHRETNFIRLYNDFFHREINFMRLYNDFFHRETNFIRLYNDFFHRETNFIRLKAASLWWDAG